MEFRINVSISLLKMENSLKIATKTAGPGIQKWQFVQIESAPTFLQKLVLNYCIYNNYGIYKIIITQLNLKGYIFQTDYNSKNNSKYIVLNSFFVTFHNTLQRYQ